MGPKRFSGQVYAAGMGFVYFYKLEAEIPQVPAGAHAQNLYSYTLLQAVQALNEKQALNCFDCDLKYN